MTSLFQFIGTNGHVIIFRKKFANICRMCFYLKFFFSHSLYSGVDRRRRSVIESWLCQSPKIDCLDVKVQQKCPQACSSNPKDNEISVKGIFFKCILNAEPSTLLTGEKHAHLVKKQTTLLVAVVS